MRKAAGIFSDCEHAPCLSYLLAFLRSSLARMLQTRSEGNAGRHVWYVRSLLLSLGPCPV
jgi:hypothetical protein